MPTLAIIKFSEGQSPDVLEEFSRMAVGGIREYLYKKTRGTGRLASSIKALVYGKQIVIQSDVPYAREVDQGFSRSKSMWNLINKVIPLKLRDGTVVFRRVTLESLLRGKWKTRPRPGLEYVERGVELAKSRLSLRAQLTIVTQTAAIS
jgi:hypothetical protein